MVPAWPAEPPRSDVAGGRPGAPSGSRGPGVMSGASEGRPSGWLPGHPARWCLLPVATGWPSAGSTLKRDWPGQHQLVLLAGQALDLGLVVELLLLLGQEGVLLLHPGELGVGRGQLVVLGRGGPRRGSWYRRRPGPPPRPPPAGPDATVAPGGWPGLVGARRLPLRAVARTPGAGAPDRPARRRRRRRRPRRCPGRECAPAARLAAAGGRRPASRQALAVGLADGLGRRPGGLRRRAGGGPGGRGPVARRRPPRTGGPGPLGSAPPECEWALWLIRTTASARQGPGAAEGRRLPQHLLDAEELVVLGHPVRAGRRAGLDLAAVGGHRQVGDGGVLGLPRAVGHHAAVGRAGGQRHGAERLGQRADLVDLDQDGVGASRRRSPGAAASRWSRRCRPPPAGPGPRAPRSAPPSRPSRPRPCRPRSRRSGTGRPGRPSTRPSAPTTSERPSPART